jgi:orotidine-5'-phosphate decarboxylase
MKRDFRELTEGNAAQHRYVCVGLDPDLDKMPAHLRSLSARDAIVAFNRAIIDATASVAAAYKPNTAFYEAFGADGWDALRETTLYAQERAAHATVIADAKRADIGNTNNGYVAAIYEYLQADAVTLHPYLGKEALQPFLDRDDKGAFILCRTSNPGAGEMQDLNVDGSPLYQTVARMVSHEWNDNENCGLVAGATYPADIEQVRQIAPTLPLLIPGIGAQGGDLEATVRAARGGVTLISASRSIIYASDGEDFATAAARSAQELHGSIIKAS